MSADENTVNAAAGDLEGLRSTLRQALAHSGHWPILDRRT
jgi:hypothetical protein